jgi:hypothetical protein
MPGPDPNDLGNDTAAGVLVILLAYGIFIGVVLLISYLLTAITLMLFFRKVGVAPGLAWVPIYNYWKWLEVGSQPGALALLLLVPGAAIVTRIFLILGMHRSDIAFGKSSEWVVLAIFLPWLWCILLAQPQEVYRPERLAEFGYPPPRAGFGSVPAPVVPA